MTTILSPLWNLSDFNTPGWDTLTPCADARVYFSYGIGSGEALGRLVRQETTRWGTHWVVAMDDGSEKSFNGDYAGHAIAKPFQGETVSEDPVVHCLEFGGIGCYVVRVIGGAS